jgi:protein-S-isoprenylcysteine O-methyltransferase Ste14
MRDVIGRPPVHPVLLVVGKAAFAFSWAVLALRLAGLDLLGVTIPAARLPALVALAAGTLVILAALGRLGNAARVGLPHEAEQTSLKTTGVYSFSRNPVYAAAIAVCIASCAFVPHWLNIVATLIAAAAHHRIVLAEEDFLRARFGPAWDAYRARVRRYL